MANYGEVEIKELVSTLFHQTYGVDASHLYIDQKMCEIIRDAVVALRKSYKPAYRNSGCESIYHNEEVRKAYMISYYPYYFEPIHRIVKSVIGSSIGYKKKYFIDCFAGGPCPEVYGAIKAISKIATSSEVDIFSYDIEKGWANYRNLTFNLCRKLVNKLTWLFAYNFDITSNSDSLSNLSAGSMKLSERWRNQTDIFLLQNYLSHIDENYQEISNFLNWFENLSDLMKPSSIFVLVDLNYNSAKQIFKILSDEDFLLENELEIIESHLPFNGIEPLCITHENTIESLRENIFIGGENLVQKKNTKYYYVALRKDGPF